MMEFFVHGKTGQQKDRAAVCGGRLEEGQEGQASWSDAESGLAGVWGRPEDV